jgi:acyl-CoA synthetase (AMP-forming)/AMP-acid ligase II
VPDPYRGETVKAVISLKYGQKATPEEIQAFAKGQMAAYKYPRTVEIMDDLPKTPSGKILRRLLVTPPVEAAPAEKPVPVPIGVRADGRRKPLLVAV